ncbi:hypothetical protein O6H91_22G035000 [Diphasiastrum complanatum]|uniref:Uncharacterized protein n=1 Tax=Diphasiastrum complanatum TaxID=34168 RepID=A0ACC2AEE3_DIPCM|nr:hypothetical protein O6H91_22G035000 [Diphasiastrum complanatum]
MALTLVTRRFFTLIMIVAAFAAVLPAGVRGSRPFVNSGLYSEQTWAHPFKSSSMEVDDLSFEQQQKVVDLGKRLEGATRELFTKDPYYTKY